MMYLRHCLRLYSTYYSKKIPKHLCASNKYNVFSAPSVLVNTDHSRFIHLSNAMSLERIATYEEIVALTEKPSVLLIDVREPDELQELGKIPTSINIPLGSVTDVLQNMSKEEFESKYGRPKPEPDTEIIFHCKVGGRSAQAMNKAIELGFKKARNYKGSFQEWCSKQSSMMSTTTQ